MKNLKKKLKRLLTKGILLGIVVYQKIFSPDRGILGNAFRVAFPLGFKTRSCRFYPSCSEYASQALRQHGLFKGGVVSFIRILKCNPWHRGGYNPVNQ